MTKKTLKHTIGVMAFLVAGSSALHAQDCGGLKVTQDEFKNEVVKKAAISVGPAAWNWQLMLEQHGGNYNLGMRIMNSGDIRYTIAKGDKIQIKLEDGNIVEIISNNDYLPVASIYGGQVVTTWLPMGDSDIETIKKLSASPITAIRLVIQGTEATVTKFKDKQTGRVMDAASCIANPKG